MIRGGGRCSNALIRGPRELSSVVHCTRGLSSSFYRIEISFCRASNGLRLKRVAFSANCNCRDRSFCRFLNSGLSLSGTGHVRNVGQPPGI